MCNSKKMFTANLVEKSRFQESAGKINIKVLKRVHKIRQVVQRKSWRPDALNPVIQAKLSNLHP